ncbi:MAG: 2OG-Fe(II) oxygenase, partial [Methanosarcinales archaeon]
MSYVKAQEDGAWFEGTIERNIHLELFPGGIALVPYKMNIYGPGGFFKSHVDTPTLDPARMLGTVVVALPSSFEGGVMSVAPPSGAGATAAGEGAPPSVRFDWAPHMAGGSVPWAAFFGDCVHEVQPVTTGYRVTITYGMVATGSKNRWWASDGCSTIARAPATTELHAQRLVQHVATAPVSRFGMVLTHKYTLTGVSATMLKGVDRVLYNALAAAGYKLTVRPVVFASRVTRPCEGDDSDATASNKIYAFGREELAAIRRGVSPPSAAEKLSP